MSIPEELQRPAVASPLRSLMESLRFKISELQAAHQQRMHDLDNKITTLRSEQFGAIEDHEKVMKELEAQHSEAENQAVQEESIASQAGTASGPSGG